MIEHAPKPRDLGLNKFNLPIGLPRPSRDLVLLRRVDAKTETDAGVQIPDDAQQKPYRAVIIAAGPGWYSPLGVLVPMPSEYVPGAHVFVNQYAGQEFEVETKVGPAQVDRQKYVLVRCDEILAEFDPAEVAQ